MRVFISWSGQRSQALAQAIHEWLPLVLHYVQPWLSHSDIEAGERWANEIAKELEASNFGIIAVTRENLNSPWILFEAGALAKLMNQGRVIPLLLDIEFKDISGPLAQFQSKKVEKSGIKEVVTAINGLAEHPIPETRVTQLFDMLWPALEGKVGAIPKPAGPAKQNRPQHEILEELVTSVRGLDVRLRENPEDMRNFRRRRFRPEMIFEMTHRLRDRNLSLLIAASYFRDAAPWLYDLAMEVYRASQYGPKESERARRRLARALRELRRGPMIEMIDSKELHFLFMEFEEFLHRPISAEDEPTVDRGGPTEPSSQN